VFYQSPAFRDCHRALTIARNEVHVWRTSLDISDFGSCEQVLSADERDRSAGFHFERDRRRFVAARAFLRSIVASYLDLSATEVEIGYTEYGKPFLDGTCARGDLKFNLAHSNELAVLAVCCGREIGVDIEYRQPEFVGERLAEHFFSPGEVAEIRSLPAELQKRAFFTCWTRKEAYIKARGHGFSIPLHEFVVAATPSKKAVLLSTAHEPTAVSHWSICDLEIEKEYESALVFEGTEGDMRVVYRN